MIIKTDNLDRLVSIYKSAWNQYTTGMVGKVTNSAVQRMFAVQDRVAQLGISAEFDARVNNH
jgi:hypothetical protein